MSDFDDVLIRNTPPSEEKPTPSNTATDRDKTRSGSRPRTAPQEPGAKSLLELLTGTEDSTALATKFNLDPDLSERLVIPLVNLLDKYGLGESIAESPTARAGAGIMEFVSDIAPVVKGAADFVNNRRKEISSEDREFLDRIRSSQESSGDLSLFIGASDDEGDDDWGAPVEEVAPEPTSMEGVMSQRISGDPFTQGVDWESVLQPMATEQANKGGGNTIIDIMPPRRSMISGIEQLALEAGLDPQEVVNKDSQRKFNRGSGHEGADYSDGAPLFNLNTDKIADAMGKERKINESTSKIRFDTLPTPTSATEYVPTKGQPLPQTPTTTFTLPSVSDLMSEAGVKQFSVGRSATGGSAVAEPAKLEESPQWEVIHPDPEEPSHMEQIVSRLDPGLLRGHGHEIFKAIAEHGSHGLTDEEGQNLLLIDGSSYRPARKRLGDSGYIITMATRENSNGNQVKVWIATTE